MKKQSVMLIGPPVNARSKEGYRNTTDIYKKYHDHLKQHPYYGRMKIVNMYRPTIFDKLQIVLTMIMYPKQCKTYGIARHYYFSKMINVVTEFVTIPGWKSDRHFVKAFYDKVVKGRPVNNGIRIEPVKMSKRSK